MTAGRLLCELMGLRLPASLRSYPHSRDRLFPQDPQLMSDEDRMLTRLRYEHYLQIVASRQEVQP